MRRTHWFLNPLPVALIVLALALVPLITAIRHYQSASRESDEALFAATAATVEEKLKVVTIRHMGWMNIARNRMTNEKERQLPPMAWRNPPSHLASLAYINMASGRPVVAWARKLLHPPIISEQTDLTTFPEITKMINELAKANFLDRQSSRSIAWGQHQVCVVMGSQQDNNGYLIGWLDLDSLCADPSVEIAGVANAVHIRALDAGEDSGGGRTFVVGDGNVQWRGVTSRGPQYGALFTHPPPYLPLVVGILSVLLLAVLAGFAAKARLTALKAIELNAALEAERELSRLRGQFINSVSHEFRTPLSVIQSSADLLLNYGDRLEGTRRVEALAQIQSSTQQIGGMVEEVLLLGRLEAQRIECKPSPVNITDLCQQVSRDIETITQSRNPLKLEMTNTPESVTLDAALVRGILTNLISNAVKYSAAGAEVSLTVSAHAGNITFSVQDSGIGIPTEDIPHVGELFRRGSNIGETLGTGLGLAIVKRSTTLHGGDFHLESELGVGTKVKITLPIS